MNIKTKRDFADALLMRSFPLALSGNKEKAAADCRQAVKTIEDLFASDPKNQELRFDVAMAYYQSSIVLVELTDWQEAGALQISTDFFISVKNGWQSEQISMCSSSPIVERVLKEWPHAQVTLIS